MPILDDFDPAGVLIDRHVEAEAMPAGEMRRLVREGVESYLPAGALQTVRIAEQSEQEWLELLGEKVDRDGLTAVLRHGR